MYLQGQHANDPNAFVSSITFGELGDRTEITLRSLFNTKARRDEVIERYGALEGARQTLSRLSSYLESLTPGAV